MGVAHALQTIAHGVGSHKDRGRLLFRPSFALTIEHRLNNIDNG
jgi:hypothetical protein